MSDSSSEGNPSPMKREMNFEEKISKLHESFPTYQRDVSSLYSRKKSYSMPLQVHVYLRYTMAWAPKEVPSKCQMNVARFMPA